MNPTTESDRHGTTERQEQKDLTGRVGTRLARPPKSPSNFKWSTWKARVAPSKEERG